MTDVDTSPSTSPAAIDAVPLRHPWRWVAAVVIVTLVVLFLYGAATNDAYRWPVFGEFLFNDRILTGVSITLQLTIYSMVLAIVLGVGLAVMRLSPNPVFKSVAWVYLWIFRGTPIYVQLAFWGLIPTIYKNISLGIPFGPTFYVIHLHRSELLRACDAGPGPQRGRLHGRNHPCRNQFRAGGPVGGVDGVGHVVGNDDAPHGASAGDAGDHPADGQRGHQHAEDHVAGDRGPVQLRPVQHCHARNRRAGVRARRAAAGGGGLVPGVHEHPDGRPVLPGAVLLARSVAQVDDQATRGAGQGRRWESRHP